MAENNLRHRQYTSVNEYTRSLQQWLWWQQNQVYFQTMAFHMMPWYHQRMVNGYSLSATQQQSASVPEYRQLGSGEFLIPNGTPVPTRQQITPTVPAAPSQDFTLPPIWKRCVAEFIDFLILLAVKILISYVVFENFGLLQEESMDLEFIFNFLNSKQPHIDYDKLITITWEMLTIQMIHRFCITVTEAIWTCRSFRGGIGGSTPGKLLMGLRVVGCDDVIGVGDQQVRVLGVRNLGVARSFLRSLQKNYGISFFFPIVFTMFLFDHKRTLYDLGAGSIVVYDRAHAPVRRN